MKKNISLIILFVCSFLLIGSNRVYAKNLYTCTYKVNTIDLAPALDDDKNLEVTFKIHITDGKKAIMTDELNKLSGTDKLGNRIINWKKSGGFLGIGASTFLENYNTEAKKNDTCPTIRFIVMPDSATIIEGALSTYNMSGALVNVLSEGITDYKKEENKIKEFCTRTSTLRNESYSIQITFAKQGNQNVFKIKVKNRNDDTGWLTADKIATDYMGNTYEIDAASIPDFFSNKCSTATLYLKTSSAVTVPSVNVIQSTKPHNFENGAYDAGNAEFDTGQSDITSDQVTPPKKDYTSGCEALGSETLTLIEDVYDLIKIAVPILIIILSIVDFAKVLLNGEEKVYKAAWSKLVKRIGIGVVLLILPAVLSIIIELSGIADTYGINDIFCIFK